MDEEYIDYLLERIEDIITIADFLKKTLINQKTKFNFENEIDLDNILPTVEDYNSLVIENHILKEKLGISSFTNYCFNKRDDTKE